MGQTPAPFLLTRPTGQSQLEGPCWACPAAVRRPLDAELPVPGSTEDTRSDAALHLLLSRCKERGSSTNPELVTSRTRVREWGLCVQKTKQRGHRRCASVLLTEQSRQQMRNKSSSFYYRYTPGDCSLTDDRSFRSKLGTPWWSRGQDSAPPVHRVWVQSLVRELDPTCCIATRSEGHS